MPKGLEPGEVAKLNYNELCYAHIVTKAGEQQILTADPWAFVQRALNERLAKKRGKNRENLERAVYFADLAEDFYAAADRADLPTKGTLTYYFMLNLAKAYIAAKGTELEKKQEIHGLSLEHGVTQTVKVHSPTTEVVNIFFEFSKALGAPVSAISTVTLLEAFGQIPELHSLYVSLGHSTKRKLLPIEYKFLVNGARDRLFVELSYQKKHETKVDTSKFLKDVRATYFRDGYPRDGWIVYRSKRRRHATKANMADCYARFISESRKFNIVSLLTRNGYRYYCDLRPGPLHHLSYSLLAMFYVGAAARYRPLEIKAVLVGDLRPLVSELVTITPKQFLYQVTSLLTEKVCLIPFSEI